MCGPGTLCVDNAPMSTFGEPALILTDGGVVGLLACYLEGVCRPAATLGSRGPDAVTQGAQSAAWFFSRAARDDEQASRIEMARHAAQLCHLGDLVVASEDGELGASCSAAANSDSTMLLLAGAEAARRGLTRIIWPVQLGGRRTETESSSDPAPVLAGPVKLADADPARHAALSTPKPLGTPADPLDRIARACDRAILAARMIAIDAQLDDFTVQTPFVDFSDDQIADLVADVDLPLDAAYFGSAGSREHARWATALARVGLMMPAPRPLGTPTTIPQGRLKAV